MAYVRVLSTGLIVLAVLTSCSSVLHESYYAPTSRLSERRTESELYDGVATTWSGPEALPSSFTRP